MTVENVDTNKVDVVDKILVDLEAWAKMGFAAGYFRLEAGIASAALPSERLRRLYAENEEKNARSTESYEEIEKRHTFVQDIIAELEQREASAKLAFSKGAKKGTDIFFLTIVFFIVLAMGTVYFIEDQEKAARTALNILSVLPIVYMPLYLFTKSRAKRLRAKAHEATDLSWVLPWNK